MDLYSQFIHKSRYARYLWEEGRREEWGETVDRYLTYIADRTDKKFGWKMPDKLRAQLHSAIYNLEVMPSMRAMMTAGPALDKENLAGYNCAYVAVDHPRAFDETLYVLMNGSGVGFSVERQFVQKLPEVPEELHHTDTVISVRDSKKGWAKALKELVALLYSGQVPSWDLSKIRPAGAPLRTFGGRASGPAPLGELLEFTVSTFQSAKGRKLTSLECHDLMCKIAEIVVVGGVRRSALISLSNVSDDRMRDAKSGQWWENNIQRALANNSAVYTDKPDIGVFMKEWQALYASKSGERGIFNRQAATKKVAESGRRDAEHEFGTNPCSEIILRSMQLCNLTEAVIRSEDTAEDIAKKVRMATVLGTLQSTLTDFNYVRPSWRKNCEEERLLGVSLTGIMDSPIMSSLTTGQVPWILADLKQAAIDTNARLAGELGIEPSAAITCVKPSGTVSQLVNSASGIHARHSPYYIRTVRGDKKDPLSSMMADMGFPVEDDVTKPEHNHVFSFPIKAPAGSVVRDDLTAIDQLELWLIYQENWCEHKPSVTISVKEHEWLEVGAWVYENFDQMSGVSFLPHADHTYAQAPYQECTEEEYEALVKEMPDKVDWTKLAEYEDTDRTTGSQEAACVAGVCEIVDVGAV